MSGVSFQGYTKQPTFQGLFYSEKKEKKFVEALQPLYERIKDKKVDDVKILSNTLEDEKDTVKAEVTIGTEKFHVTKKMPPTFIPEITIKGKDKEELVCDGTKHYSNYAASIDYNLKYTRPDGKKYGDYSMTIDKYDLQTKILDIFSNAIDKAVNQKPDEPPKNRNPYAELDSKQFGERYFN
jgi:hypothetical protein